VAVNKPLLQMMLKNMIMAVMVDMVAFGLVVEHLLQDLQAEVMVQTQELQIAN
jgi:hypothetical protein